LRQSSEQIESAGKRRSDVIEYPTILRRYMATVIDGSLVIIVFLVVSSLLQQNAIWITNLRVVTVLGFALLYEPIFTSLGCTLGQRTVGVRVRKREAFTRINIFTAWLRIVVKIVMGIYSFLSIPFTKERRGLHDFVAGTVVVLESSLAAAKVQEEQVASSAMP
jgi:uncharacterized RDD family membrane protein YckC